jgi:hypothetical protein
METLRKEGIHDESLEKKANELEEEIIKKEILPILTKNIEPALQPVKRELVLVVDYLPGKPLSVHLSRKRNFAADMPDAKEIVIDPEVEHDKHEIHNIETRKKRPASDMVVFFPDGTMITESKVTDTFVKVVKKIGIAAVRQVVEDYNLKCCKVPVISNRRDIKYGQKQKDLGGGWLLMTNSNNLTKKAFIEKVSEVLHLGLKVEIYN